MRDHIICILQNARTIYFEAASVCAQELAEAICTEAMAALHGGVTIIPSKVFGEIRIPQDVITKMSNGDSDLWFSHGCALDVNLFYTSLGWGYIIHPVKNGQTDTTIESIIDKGQL